MYHSAHFVVKFVVKPFCELLRCRWNFRTMLNEFLRCNIILEHATKYSEERLFWKCILVDIWLCLVMMTWHWIRFSKLDDIVYGRAHVGPQCWAHCFFHFNKMIVRLKDMHDLTEFQPDWHHLLIDCCCHCFRRQNACSFLCYKVYIWCFTCVHIGSFRLLMCDVLASACAVLTYIVTPLQLILWNKKSV